MRILSALLSAKANILRTGADIMGIILRMRTGLGSVDLADEAFEVFGFGQIEQDWVILGCASAFEQGDAAVGVDGG